MSNVEFTLANPTQALEFVLAHYRDAFFAFLMADTPEPTKEQMRRAIDFVIGIIGDEHSDKNGKPLNSGAAQFFINPKTQAGLQNLYVTWFFCHFMQAG